MITLREITRDNYLQCLALKVKQEQSDFVASNAFSLAQSKYQPEYIPLAIYAEDVMVGFLMHGVDLDDDNHWICRLMIDEKYQGKGYATQAMKQLIRSVILDKSRDKILISFEPNNKQAELLYAKLGFSHTGQIIEDEVVMQLNY